MGRQLRPDVPGARYHVMNRGAAHQTTFFGDEDRVEFGRLLSVGHDRFGVAVTAYCLMGNHYHLVLDCPDGRLSEYMQNLGSVLTRHTNERVDRDGPLYRGRFRSIPITDDRQLLASVRYVHRNALDIRGVDAVDDYRWSSHRTYLGHRRTPPWLSTDIVMHHFSYDAASFHRFVTSDDTGPDEHLDVASLDASIELVAQERRAGLGPGSGRTILLLVLDQVSDERTRAQIAQQLGYTDEQRLSKALWRARRRADQQPALTDIADRAIALSTRRPVSRSCV